jgi:hypothetical protein
MHTSFCFVLTFCVFSTCLFGTPQNRMHEVLSHFSDTERQQLSLFFEEAIVHDSFGYTLFGKKPVSFIGFFAVPQYAGPSWIIRDHIALYEGAKLCCRLNSLIIDSDFSLKFQYDPEYQQTFLYLINKKEFLHIVQTHISLFKDVLGETITAQQLLHDVLNPDSKIEKVLRDSEGLLGIIFGFGVKNSFMFQRNAELRDKIRTHYCPPASLPSTAVLRLFFFDRHNSSPEDSSNPIAEKMSDDIEEYITLQKCLGKIPKSPRNYLINFSLPSFLGDVDDPETQALVDHYRKIRIVINHAYAHGNFLEVSLCKILGD